MVTNYDGEQVEIPQTLPMLPVRDIVVFPYMIIPLFVGRDSSIKAVEEALSRSDRLILLASQKDISDVRQQALWSECDRKFHHQLALMTGDVLIAKIADEIDRTMAQPLWNRLRDDGIYDAERIQLYVAEHRLIYEAIVSGDEEAAAFYVEGHLKRVHRDISSLE